MTSNEYDALYILITEGHSPLEWQGKYSNRLLKMRTCAVCMGSRVEVVREQKVSERGVEYVYEKCKCHSCKCAWMQKVYKQGSVVICYNPTDKEGRRIGVNRDENRS